jgi:hypothetical protein
MVEKERWGITKSLTDIVQCFQFRFYLSSRTVVLIKEKDTEALWKILPC